MSLDWYVLSVGSAGDPPVPSGGPPDGTGGGIERKGTVFPPPDIGAIPPGESPGGAGESPAPPSLTHTPRSPIVKSPQPEKLAPCITNQT